MGRWVGGVDTCNRRWKKVHKTPGERDVPRKSDPQSKKGTHSSPFLLKIEPCMLFEKCMHESGLSHTWLASFRHSSIRSPHQALHSYGLITYYIILAYVPTLSSHS